MIEELFEGFNSCVMAYGQTGSGKTHTIFGSLDAIEEIGYSPVHEDTGVVPRLVEGLFEYISANTRKC
jgi:hypothetical protein